MTNETLHERAVEWVKTFKRAEGELIALLQMIDERRSYLEHGVSSLFRYCTECLGLTEAESFRYTQVTRKATEVPVLKEAISRGHLSVSKASRIVPVLNRENATEWIERAKALTYRDLEKEVVAINPEPAKRETLRPVSEKESRLSLTLSTESEKLIRRAQSLLAQRLTTFKVLSS